MTEETRAVAAHVERARALVYPARRGFEVPAADLARAVGEVSAAIEHLDGVAQRIEAEATRLAGAISELDVALSGPALLARMAAAIDEEQRRVVLGSGIVPAAGANVRLLRGGGS